MRSVSLALLLGAGCLDPLGTTSQPPATSSSADDSDDDSDDDTSDDDAGSSSSSSSSSEGSMDGSAATSADGSTGTSSAGDDPLCGDGHVDPGEACDDGLAGNDENGACLVNCTLARCGDGHVFTLQEECDDANADPLDGCDACGRTRRVFVTSATYQGASFMGLWGADQRCRSLAAQAGLPNFAGYMAWLSDSATSPRARMVHGRGRYELVNGLLVAEDFDALLELGPLTPIVVTEKSETHEIPVWTGTNPDGTEAEGSDHCADWTSQMFLNSAFIGYSNTTTVDWTLADYDFNPIDCGAPSALYCFEQD